MMKSADVDDDDDDDGDEQGIKEEEEDDDDDEHEHELVRRPSEWVTKTSAEPFPFVPQINDCVAFFREGYKEFYDAARQAGYAAVKCVQSEEKGRREECCQG